ncbi:STAS domain-containing protein [Xanthobacter autotrophicus]|uniref:STAS domain-containing protein n=1 Tax=Xanthobacter TaxID=279 RepID=UPI0024AA1C0D|nr:STAS domain-containing protein [Xanthobacter autotrophicus]MDI4665235.1 STAS domain-containing protein [Xanthobacter autotrophicus]
MKIESKPLGPGLVLVSLDGRLDIAGAAQVEPQFKAACDEAALLLVDLSRTPFMASIGIRLLLAGAKGLRRKGGAMHLFACDPQVEKVLVTTGVDQLVAIHATRDEALAAAGAASGT